MHWVTRSLKRLIGGGLQTLTEAWETMADGVLGAGTAGIEVMLPRGPRGASWDAPALFQQSLQQR
jgi:hypothetical protein